MQEFTERFDEKNFIKDEYGNYYIVINQTYGKGRGKLIIANAFMYYAFSHYCKWEELPKDNFRTYYGEDAMNRLKHALHNENCKVIDLEIIKKEYDIEIINLYHKIPVNRAREWHGKLRENEVFDAVTGSVIDLKEEQVKKIQKDRLVQIKHK